MCTRLVPFKTPDTFIVIWYITFHSSCLWSACRNYYLLASTSGDYAVSNRFLTSIFSLKDCAWYNVYTFTLRAFSFLSYSFFPVNFLKLFTNAHTYAPLNMNDIYKWSKHIFTIQIWVYSVLICLKKNETEEKENKQGLYVMEGWAYT